MTALRVEDVFSRSRLQMVTSRQVEVFREAAAPGERRRYTKRFLATTDGDFRPWTARESRILAHLRSHGVRCVPELVGLDTGNDVMQTLDAGVTVDHCVTLLQVQRDARVIPHVFADCAHWWELAHHTLRALETLHLNELVHLDVKADNICVPILPAGFAPEIAGATMGVQFARLALIDFAFSLLPAEPLAEPLPIGRQPTYRYQSPRLLEALEAGRAGDLRPMTALDWRCDMYSLAAMLRLFLPVHRASEFETVDGWSGERHSHAIALLAALDDAHDRDVGSLLPHQALIEMCEAEMREPDLVASLMQGFALAPAGAASLTKAPSTPLTCIETRRVSAESAPVSTTTPSVVRNRSQIVALRAAAHARDSASNAPVAREAQSISASANKSTAPIESSPEEANPAPSVARTRSRGAVAQRPETRARGAVAQRPEARVRGAVAKKTVKRGTPRAAAAAIRPTAPHASSAPKSATSTPVLLSGAPFALPNNPRRDARPLADLPRVTSLPPPSRQHVVRPRPAHAVVAAALVIALGITLYARDQRQGSRVASQDTDSAATSGATTPPPAVDRVATAPSVAQMSVGEQVRSASDRPTKRPSGELSIDAATVQRAANADPRDTSHAQSRDTQLADVRDVPAPQPDATITPARQAPPPVSSPQSRDTKQGEPRASVRVPERNNVPMPERDILLKPSQQAPPVSARPPSETRSAGLDKSSPPLPRQTETAAASNNRPLAPRVAEQTERAAEPQAPAPQRPVAPSQSDERTVAMVPASGLENVAARTARDVERVLATAATVEPGNEEKIVQVAQSMRPVLGAPHIPTESPPLARRLNAEARAAWERQDIDRALTLQQRAFRANPNDAEVTGNLAFYYLKVRPAQPALARRLALYALAARGASSPAGRVEDWGTLAVASSLEGREADAVKAMYVMFTVSRNPERACRAAQLAVAQYGDPMKVPAHAMLSRIRARGGIPNAPSCR